MLFFFCPLSSLLTERYGARVVTMTGGILMSVGLLVSSYAQQLNILYITYGVIFGFGSALAYLPTLVMVGQYFEKRRSLATGIATCGSNTGALSLAIVQEVVLNKHGWRNVFRFNSGFALVVIMCGVIFRPLIPVPTRERPMVAKAIGFKKKFGLLMRNKKFILWCMASTAGTFGYFIPLVHLLRYAEDNKVSLHKATLLITYMSAGSAVGKIIYGRISDHFQSWTPIIYMISMFISGLSSILFSLVSTSYTGLVVYVIIFGLLDGSFIGLMSIMAFKCTGSLELMSHSWGISLMFMSCSMIVGPPTVGWVRDAGISYKCLFYLTGGPMILGALILLPTIWMKNEASFPDNSIVLMNDPALPESNSQHRIEIERLTVL
ncbi:monocarboxylate transporter 10-like [Paramuricea clavata]|nr:monocarboxylate transporter 10-like [Paramuricea clavata]